MGAGLCWGENSGILHMELSNTMVKGRDDFYPDEAVLFNLGIVLESSVINDLKLILW